VAVSFEERSFTLRLVGRVDVKPEADRQDGSPWVSWRLLTLEVRMEHAERDESGEADVASVFR